ncbi:hypothetical protein [Thalassotalea litorea]|uniref:hypothetical protein n=1 Tax=Thalassotalea litorea TaxID=2020715 RepID=UPI003736B603
MNKILLHTYGTKKFLLYAGKSALQLSKAIFILFVLTLLLNFFSGGIDGIKSYGSSVDYLELLKTVLVFLVSISIIFIIFVVGYNLHVSISYCSNNSMKLTDFYKKESKEIISIWAKNKL